MGREKNQHPRSRFSVQLPLGGSGSLVQLALRVIKSPRQLCGAAAVWQLTAPDMSQGKAGRVPATCMGLLLPPDPGCSCRSLSAAVVIFIFF